jgi:hypothetical protein
VSGSRVGSLVSGVSVTTKLKSTLLLVRPVSFLYICILNEPPV